MALSGAAWACCGAAPASGAETKPIDSLDGTWLPVTAEIGGTPFPEEVRKIITLKIKANEYRVTVGDVLDRGTIQVDATKSPKSMDLKGVEGPNKDRTIPAIYELQGDSLQICYDLSGQRRPTEFKSTAGTQQFLVRYQREKK
jgi:uncharacterized protein (TIGR03067 family)